MSATAEINKQLRKPRTPLRGLKLRAAADFTSRSNKTRGQPGRRGFQLTVLANPALCGRYVGNVVRVKVKAWIVFRISTADPLYKKLRVFKAAEVSERDSSS